VAKKESNDGIDLRRKAALTCRPAVSANETERRWERGHPHVSWACGHDPRRTPSGAS
jgi:hypothetical protein